MRGLVVPKAAATVANEDGYDISGYDLSRYEAPGFDEPPAFDEPAEAAAEDREPLRLTGTDDPDAADEEDEEDGTVYPPGRYVRVDDKRQPNSR